MSYISGMPYLQHLGFEGIWGKGRQIPSFLLHPPQLSKVGHTTDRCIRRVECCLHDDNIFSCKYLTSVDCGPPVAPWNGSLESYTHMTEASEVFYSCDSGLVPEGRMRAVCTRNGWSPNPSDLCCTVGMYKLVSA